MNNNYQPNVGSVVGTSLAAPMKAAASLNLPLWDLLLVTGRITANGAPLASAAILLGTTSPCSIGNAQYITFTDALGKYGITVQTKPTYYMKVYS